ncbi:hypothetical protein ACFQ9X_19540 [Catenulispora yoronensis]
MEPPVSPAWATHSSTVRDAAALDPAPGPARVLRLLDAARPADVADVLGALTPEALAEAVASIPLPLAPAVIAAMLGAPPSPARDELACRLVQQPESVPIRTRALPEFLRAMEDAAADDYRDVSVSRLRLLALEALRAGTLTAEQVLEHARPAVLAVTLGVCTPEEYVWPGARRATGDVRVLLRDGLAAALGEDDDRWSAVIEASGSFDGTFAELLLEAGQANHADQTSPHTHEPPGGFRRFFCSPRTHHNPLNLLLGLAPRAVAERYLNTLHDAPAASGPLRAEPSSPAQHRWGWMLTNGPLTRPWSTTSWPTASSASAAGSPATNCSRTRRWSTSAPAMRRKCCCAKWLRPGSGAARSVPSSTIRSWSAPGPRTWPASAATNCSTWCGSSPTTR